LQRRPAGRRPHSPREPGIRRPEGRERLADRGGDVPCRQARRGVAGVAAARVMRIREPFEWPADKARLRRRAIVLEWATIGAMASVILVMGLVMGSSQAMRTAWFEDILGPIPAIAFLIAARLERRPPNENFPLGYYRSMSIAYL